MKSILIETQRKNAHTITTKRTVLREDGKPDMDISQFVSKLCVEYTPFTVTITFSTPAGVEVITREVPE